MQTFLLLASTATDTTRTFFYENWPIIKQLIWLFGKCMSGIMWALDQIGIGSICLSIVLFTVLSKFVLLPLTIKQQKATRLQSVIQPEIQAIQKKYAGKRDSISQQKMMAEQQAVQDKYGVSMFSGCLPTLVQMPILFALYPVVYNMPKYVDYLTSANLIERYPNMYTFLGIDLTEAPGWKLSLAILIPILVAVSQYLSTKIMTATQKTPNGSENPMAKSMKTMNLLMPLMLGFFAVNFPAFLGIYWIVQSVVTTLQMLVINKQLAKVPIEDIIQENIEKANKKRARKGQPPINDKANISTRHLGVNTPANENTAEKEADKAEKLRKANEYYASRSANPGSLAAKANMVRDYNERNNKK